MPASESCESSCVEISVCRHGQARDATDSRDVVQRQAGAATDRTSSHSNDELEAEGISHGHRIHRLCEQYARSAKHGQRSAQTSAPLANKILKLAIAAGPT